VAGDAKSGKTHRKKTTAAGSGTPVTNEIMPVKTIPANCKEATRVIGDQSVKSLF
jgi:hypothetical protein